MKIHHSKQIITGNSEHAPDIVAHSPVIRQSARKVRLVADAVRRMRIPAEIIDRLEFVPNRAAQAVRQTLKQAVANATNNLNVPEQTLTLRGIEVNEGPTMKRVRFGSRGRIKPILKRTSRISITLSGLVEKRRGRA